MNNLNEQYASFFIPFLIKKEKEENVPLFWINISRTIGINNQDLNTIIFDDKTLIEKKLSKNASQVKNDSFFEIK